MATIKMGNKEIILYMRQAGNGFNTNNAYLGKLIWDWLCERGANKVGERVPCNYNLDEETKIALRLPKNAAVFEFDDNLLPALYKYLSTIN
ncbi:MAG: hypothetical protein WCH34_11625 [Bacteroidota bacterium]